jgi:hypothetical protein
MTDLTLADLLNENHDLRQLVIRLSTILLRNAVEQRELISLRSNRIASRVLAAMTPVGLVGRLREVSLRCGELSRASADAALTRAFEELSVELANEAISLEQLLRVPDGSE